MDSKVLEHYQHSTDKLNAEHIRTTLLLLYRSTIWTLELFHSRHINISHQTRHYLESALGSVVLVDPGVTATVDPQYQVALPLGTPQNTIEYSPITIGKTTNEDWGFINITGTKYPFGVTRLKSETLINFVPNYVTQGDIYITGDARARTNPIWFSLHSD